MRHIFAIVFAILLMSFRSAAAVTPACTYPFWSHFGKIDIMVKAYDDFYSSMPEGEKGIKAANEFLAKSGLPQMIAAPDKAKSSEFPDRLESDGPSGRYAVVFLKKMKVRENSEFDLDRAHEVADKNAKKAIRSWKLPFNSGDIRGVEGDELLVGYDMRSLCGGTAAKKMWLAIKPSGQYRLMEAKAAEPLPEEGSCPAAKAVEPKSGYTICNEVIDQKTKKKKVIIWQAQTT